MAQPRRKKRVLFRRKRTLDPSISIDYKFPEVLKRFVTDRGKIIPRRISGATAKQQRSICQAVKRARYLALLPYSLAHRSEKNFAAEMSAIATSTMGSSRGMGRGGRPPRDRDDRGPRGDRGERGGDRGERSSDRPERGDRPAPADRGAQPDQAKKTEES